MFCRTCEEVSSLACICHHGPHSHQQIAGVRTASGAYLSRYTAEYPPLLAMAFAKCILGLIDHNGRDLSLDEIETHIPCKDLHVPPFVRQDGGGLTSCGDWSHPPSKTSDVFQVLRQHWIRQIISQRLDKQLTHFQNRIDSPPFSEEQDPSNCGLKSFWRQMVKQQIGPFRQTSLCIYLSYRVSNESQTIKTPLCSGISLKVSPRDLMQQLNHLIVFRSTLMSPDRIHL